MCLLTFFQRRCDEVMSACWCPGLTVGRFHLRLASPGFHPQGPPPGLWNWGPSTQAPSNPIITIKPQYHHQTPSSPSNPNITIKPQYHHQTPSSPSKTIIIIKHHHHHQTPSSQSNFIITIKHNHHHQRPSNTTKQLVEVKKAPKWLWKWNLY